MNMEHNNGDTALTRDVLTHHLDCFGNGDLAGITADYTDESRFFTPDDLLRGSEYRRLFGQPPQRDMALLRVASQPVQGERRAVS
jgi:hypothetical protein